MRVSQSSACGLWPLWPCRGSVSLQECGISDPLSRFSVTDTCMICFVQVYRDMKVFGILPDMKKELEWRTHGEGDEEDLTNYMFMHVYSYISMEAFQSKCLKCCQKQNVNIKKSCCFFCFLVKFESRGFWLVSRASQESTYTLNSKWLITIDIL